MPANYVPKNETEKALQDSLRDMELQCKERVDLLEALRKSRKDSKEKGKSSATAPVRGISTIGSKPDSAHVPPLSNWLGEGTIPPVNYPDLSRPIVPPPLPRRPALSPKQDSFSPSERSNSTAQASLSQLHPAYSPPTLPVPPRKTSRTPSPDKKGGRMMLTTLRGPKDARKSSKSPKVSSGRFSGPPPVSSKAAGLAWDTSSRTPGQKVGQYLAGRNGSYTTLDSSRRDSAGGNTSSRPESTNVTDNEEPGLFGGSLLRPTARTPPDLLSDQPMKNVIDDGRKMSNHVSYNGSSALSDLINLEPPTPPAQDTTGSNSAVGASRTKSPARPKPPVDYPSYRTEFPPAAPSSKATAEFLARTQKRADDTNTTDSVPRQPSPPRRSKPQSAAGLPRRPVANSSTPRTTRHGKGEKARIDLNESNEENSSSGHEVAEQKRRVAQKSRKDLVAADPAANNDNNSDEGTHDNSDQPKTWKERLKHVKKNLPKGVDEQAAKQIFNEIVVQGDEVHWTDVAGLEIAKKALKEAVVYPFLRPDLFMGLREPARGMLLFGPPGTGKTMLARAVATESRSTFFAISASSLTSKWLGESEKLVRALFALAKALAPSIIFVDEIDSLLSSRGGSSEHETTRRIKTEFLIQWSDLQRAAAGKQQSEKEKAEGDASRVLVLAATNMPWAIDEAARRRFVRRQYIPLPEAHVRAEQIRTLLGHQKHGLSKKDIAVLVELTDGKLMSSDVLSFRSGYYANNGELR